MKTRIERALKPSLLGGILLTLTAGVCAAPTVFPTGTTIYQPAEAWNGFTVLSILDTPAVIVIDMNGRVVKRWDGFNVSSGGPARLLPGGSVIAPSGAHPPHQEALELVQRDFNGNTTWSFNHSEQIENADGESMWSSRQHHDWQRADFPAGYYSPDAVPAAAANTLLLTHSTRMHTDVADVTLEDDRLIEISATGELLWEWRASEHIDEFRFSEDARATIRSAGSGTARGYDWLHVNSADYVGANPWFEAGDARFAPDNVIISSRQASLIAIVARDGSVVWQLGPDFSRDAKQQALGQIIGQHHAHFIPPGLPGAGNLLVFDNGGSSGYGAPSAIAPTGVGIYARATSRVLEINPVTLERVWMYAASNFFSTNISSAQRLANGNTLITEGAPGRVFEVTAEGTIVWEYMNAPGEAGRKSNGVYRAYRVPYGWIPQLTRPVELPVTAPAPGEFIIEPR
jgi:hypothetical protein